jgi:uncharacterized protein
MSLPLTGSFDTSELPRIAGDPVTVTVARTIAPGWEAEFLRWSDDLVEAAKAAPGCLGAAVFHPGDAGGEYQIVVRFADGVMLREWERSEVRNELMDRADRFVTSARLQRTVGVDEWFEAAAHAPAKRARWRQLLVDVAWVYPVSMLMTLFISPHIGATVITAALQVFVGPVRRDLRSRRRL